MLSTKAKKRLINMLTRKSWADELEAAIFANASLSAKLKRAIEVSLANKKAAFDFIDAVEANGAQGLDLDTKRRVILEMAHKELGLELIAAVEAAN